MYVGSEVQYFRFDYLLNTYTDAQNIQKLICVIYKYDVDAFRIKERKGGKKMDPYIEMWRKHDEDVKQEMKIRRMIHEEVIQLPSSQEFRLIVQDIIKKEMDFPDIQIKLQNNINDELTKEITKQLKKK